MELLKEVAPPGFGHTKSGKGDKKGGTAAAFDKARKEGRFKGSKSDMFAIMWAMKKKIGDTIEIIDGNGSPKSLIIVGLLENSILQGSLAISEDHFVELFPRLKEK